MTEYTKVRYRNRDSVKIKCYRGVYKDHKVSIIFSDDHNGWLFYIEKKKFSYNSMRGGFLYESMKEAIEGAENMIDERIEKGEV